MTSDSPPLSRRSRVSHKALIRERRTTIAFLSPGIIILLAFLAAPIIWVIVLAFLDRSLTGAAANAWNWIGLENFRSLITSSEFWTSIKLTIVYVVASAVLGQAALGFALALLLRRRPRWLRSAVGATVVMAWVIPEIVSAYLWYAMLSQNGTVSKIESALNLPHRDFLTESPMLSIILANSWRAAALAMMIFQAGLSDIPSEVLESASVDGAGSVRRVVSIMIPLVKGPILTVLLLVTLATLQSFTLPYAMTGGGPGNDSMLAAVYVYIQGLDLGKISFASAASMVLLVIGGVISVIYVRGLRVRD